MARQQHNLMRDPEDKRSAGRQSKPGRSGYGSDSVRPYLRAQLEQRDLMRPSFPPPDDEEKPQADG